MRLPLALRGFLTRFARDDRGSIAVEAVVILPMMFWTFLALYGTFHSYRTYAVNQKAAYTIADMISRETNPLDGTYLDGTRSLLRYLTASQNADVTVRVTVVRYNLAANKYERVWSEARGTEVAAASAAEVEGWDNRLPTMPDNEIVIVVETYYDYDPPFDTGLARHDVYNYVYTRPRYSPQVCWQQCT